MPKLATTHNDPGDDKARLRLWLRLLQSTRKLETELRERLRLEFNITLPRFDVLAALFRKPEGMLMSELSRYLVVSNGNVTGIIDRLVADCLVMRTQRKGDRRTSIVRLTDQGHKDFEKMAKVHEVWVNELLGDISPEEAENLTHMLEQIKVERKSR
jgi:DNA-binding MarR family transcriptional regulator